MYKDDIKFLRKLLSNFSNAESFLRDTGFIKFEEKPDKAYGKDGEIGYLSVIYYNRNTNEYVEVSYADDSYGDNTHTIGVEFVNPIKTKITKYVKN